MGIINIFKYFMYVHGDNKNLYRALKIKNLKMKMQIKNNKSL